MNLMSNENITWTVERERGISFDLTALCDIEVKPDNLLDIKREIKLEAESGVKDSTFGHPFGQCRPTPQPRPLSPSPFSRSIPTKRSLPRSFESRNGSAKRQWEAPAPPAPSPAPAPSLGRTRSQGVRPSSPKSAPDTCSSNKSSAASARVKTERGEARAHRRRAGGVDTEALTAELGLVDSRRRCARRNKGAVHRVGAYTLEERAALVAKFHAKRGRRIWRKKIKYDCRKKLADKRPRLKGRFVTQEELDGLDKETLAKVTGLGPYEPDSSSSDVEDDSDSSEGYSGPASTTSRHRGGRGYGAGDRRQEALIRCPPSRSPSTRPGLRSSAGAVDAAVTENSEVCAKAPKTDPEIFVDHHEEEQRGLGGGVGGVSSSYQVSALFAVKTEADVDVDQETEDEEETVVKVEGYEPTDLVSGFMVDDIPSNNFAIMPNRDMEAVSAGVIVN